MVSVTSPILEERGAFDKLAQLERSVEKRLKRILRAHGVFHLFFMALGMGQLVALVTSFPRLVASSMLALSLSSLFLTVFSYFALRLYLGAKKPDQLLHLRDLFVSSVARLTGEQLGTAEYHLWMAGAASRLAGDLHNLEYGCYPVPHLFGALRKVMERLSCWAHWKDLLLLREQLLTFAIEEQIKVVRCEPTDLEVHAALANSMVMLSRAYYDPRSVESLGDGLWLPPGRYSEEMKAKFRKLGERAIEELEILRDYAPSDPWVHEQLAYAYADLGMVEDEIREHETLLKLCPDDLDTLFKLGSRYFQQGWNAKGLRVFERLREFDEDRADDLLLFYGADL
jgi:tetratricopeptide (TPR) repeat protein